MHAPLGGVMVLRAVIRWPRWGSRSLDSLTDSATFKPCTGHVFDFCFATVGC